MLSFKRYIKETNKIANILWAPMKLPSIYCKKYVEECLKSINCNESLYIITPSKNVGAPLTHSEQVKYLRKMLPKYARNILETPEIENVEDAVKKFKNQKFNKIRVFVENDSTIINNDSDVDTVFLKNTHIKDDKKLIEEAKANNFGKFKEGLPQSFKEAQSLFDDVRKGLGINKESDYRIKVNLNKDAIREKYFSGKLFSQGDNVIDKITNENCVVKFLGSNYVIVENDKGESNRRWITDISHIDEETPALDAARDRKEREKDALKQKYEREKQSARERDRRAKEMRSEEKTFKSFTTYRRIRRK